MTGFRSFLSVFLVVACVRAEAAWWCPDAMLHAVGLGRFASTRAPKPDIDWSKYIPRWYPQHMECRSVDGALVRTPISGTPKKQYTPVGRYNHFDENVFFEQKLESGHSWALNGSAILGATESYSLPTKKTVKNHFHVAGASITNWCEEVEVEMTVTLKNAGGNTHHQAPVVCQDMGCFGFGKR